MTNTNDLIRGAIYIPAKAYNAPQFWRFYEPSVTARDLGYASVVHVNALRVWVSYEYWRMKPDAFTSAFEDFLTQAAQHGIRVMPSLFENCGVPPTEENMWNIDPANAYAIRSPHKEEIVDRPERWGEPMEFLDWFMKRYANDQRLLAIEVFNEPYPEESMRFVRALLKRASEQRGSVPLTFGGGPLEMNLYFLDCGLDILQIHENFPASTEHLQKKIAAAQRAERILGRPVWLTEWQRIRPSGGGWNDGDVVPEEERGPDLASCAETIYRSGIGSFFWSLMVKIAYLPQQRPRGTFNGLFWEDGAVWSLADARAIAGDPNLSLKERRNIPAFR